jgi:hypothetical protein
VTGSSKQGRAGCQRHTDGITTNAEASASADTEQMTKSSVIKPWDVTDFCARPVVLFSSHAAR